MNRFCMTLCASLLSLLLFLSCSVEEGERWQVHRSQKTISSRVDIIDTLYVDASSTSLSGDWCLVGDSFYYADKSVVGIYRFDLNGKMLSHHIEKGRGPGETVDSFVCIDFDAKGNLYAVNSMWTYFVFDPSISKELSSYYFLSEKKYKGSDWNKLLAHPNPESDNMYEFNLSSRQIRAFSDKILVPVTTEHISFNAFGRSNRKRFWSESYNFMIIDPYHGRVVSKFGHFPELYRKRHIPSFYSYRFDIDGDRIYTGYAADSLIYVRDLNGKPIEAFGRSFEGFDDRFPENSSFSDYEATFRKYKAEQAYYQDIKVVDGLVFRTYKKAFDHGYGVQVYKDYSLIADLPFNEPVRVLGAIDRIYYAVATADIEKDVFIIYSFKFKQ